MLILLEERLENVRNSPDLPKVIRIAAIAGLLVVKKYSKLSELSEVYQIAMGKCLALVKCLPSSRTTVMCPDQKLTCQWFDEEGAANAEQAVRLRWSETYEAISDPEALLQPDGSPIKVR